MHHTWVWEYTSGYDGDDAREFAVSVYRCVECGGTADVDGRMDAQEHAALLAARGTCPGRTYQITYNGQTYTWTGNGPVSALPR